MRLLLALLLVLTTWGCAGSAKSKSTPANKKKEYKIGSVKIAIIGPRRKYNMVVVNESNQTYLQLKDFAKNRPRREAPTTAFYYQDPYLPGSNPAVAIIEDEVMAHLLDLLANYAFYAKARACSPKELQDPHWPEREAIVVDQGGNLMVLSKPGMVDSRKMVSKDGEAYRIIKFYSYRAYRDGYRPMRVLQNIDGVSIFEKSRKQLDQDAKSHDVKK